MTKIPWEKLDTLPIEEIKRLHSVSELRLKSLEASIAYSRHKKNEEQAKLLRSWGRKISHSLINKISNCKKRIRRLENEISKRENSETK